MSGDTSKAAPLMFSFPGDDQKNRALLKVSGSDWSKPQSFNALGSSYEVSLPAQNGRGEMKFGVTVSQGEGKVIRTTSHMVIIPLMICSIN